MTTSSRTHESNRHVEGLVSRETCLLEEVSAIVDEVDAAQSLRAVDADGNLGPSPIHLCKAIHVRAASLNLLLQPIRLHDKGQRSRNVDAGRRKPPERLVRILGAILAHQPPRALWDKRHAGDDGHDPEPLQGKGERVRAVAVHPLRAGGDAVAEELPDDEAQVHKGGEVAADGGRADLGGVGRRDDDKHAQDEAGEQFAREEDAQRARKELDEDEAGDENDAGAKGALAAKHVHGVGCA